jgi:hypothetical protein
MSVPTVKPGPALKNWKSAKQTSSDQSVQQQATFTVSSDQTVHEQPQHKSFAISSNPGVEQQTHQSSSGQTNHKQIPAAKQNSVAGSDQTAARQTQQTHSIPGSDQTIEPWTSQTNSAPNYDQLLETSTTQQKQSAPSSDQIAEQQAPHTSSDQRVQEQSVPGKGACDLDNNNGSKLRSEMNAILESAVATLQDETHSKLSILESAVATLQNEEKSLLAQVREAKQAVTSLRSSVENGKQMDSVHEEMQSEVEACAGSRVRERESLAPFKCLHDHYSLRLKVQTLLATYMTPLYIYMCPVF